jgi:hypothetical protein
MAIPWLDVVRFADTIGYHSDNPRNVWPYRDYVINAFNSNKRFDQFTLEQIAGDLLPESGQEQKIGSAFNRLLLSTEEGGAQAKDYESRMLTDRVRAVGTAWLGQTIGCAQCHDHKFDPISTRDFYTLGAFFADIKEGIIGAREAGMLVFTPEQKKQHDSLTAQLAGLTSEFGKNRPELAPGQQAWETDFSAAVSAETGTWRSLTPVLVSTEKTTSPLRSRKTPWSRQRLLPSANSAGSPTARTRIASRSNCRSKASPASASKRSARTHPRLAWPPTETSF